MSPNGWDYGCAIFSGVDFLPGKHEEVVKRNWLLVANSLEAEVSCPFD